MSERIRDAAKRLLEGGRAYRDGAHSEQGDLQAVADDYLVLTADLPAEPAAEADEITWKRPPPRVVEECVIVPKADYAALQAELAKLRAVIANDTETELAARAKAAEVLGDKANGSSDGVPSVADLVDILVAENARLRGENAELFLGLDTVRRQKESAERELVKLREERDEARAERDSRQAIVDGQAKLITDQRSRAESAERAAAELRQRVAELVELLLRLDGWDHMQASADGCYWQGEIRKAVQSANECAMRVAELESKGAK